MSRTHDEEVLRRIDVARAYKQGVPPSEIKRLFGCNDHYILRWREGRVLSDFEDSPRSGRPRVTTPAEDRSLERTVTRKRRASEVELAQIMEERTGKRVSRQTVSRRLHEMGFEKMRDTPVPLLTDRHMELRVQHAKKMLREDLSEVVFEDECAIYLDNEGHAVWKRRGEVVEAPTTGYSPHLSVLAAISWEGPVTLVTYEGALDADLYRQCLEEHIIPDANALYPGGWKYIQDNAPPHTAKVVKELVSEAEVEDLGLSPKSPDLNPIENFWATLKIRVGHHKFKSLAALREKIEAKWAEVEAEELQKYINDLPRRYREVISSGGLPVKGV